MIFKNNNLITLTKNEEECLSNYDLLELIGEGKLLKFSRLKLRMQMNIEQ